MLKRTQLWLHTRYPEIKHWLLIAMAAVLLVFSMVSISKQNTLLQQVRILSAQNKSLSDENKTLNTQTKRLGENNNALAQKSNNYIACVAEVFAAYTQNRQPVKIVDLDACKTEPTSSSRISGSTGVTTPKSSQGLVQSSLPSSINSNSTTAPSQSDNVQPPTPTPSASIPVVTPVLNFIKSLF